MRVGRWVIVVWFCLGIDRLIGSVVPVIVLSCCNGSGFVYSRSLTGFVSPDGYGESVLERAYGLLGYGGDVCREPDVLPYLIGL